ncbi:E3 ubiquitin-protein ligase TRIM37-like [Toxorhynchites rutilus septentrionalis]|uniref:E3 ubiquitin-protein ligase TRIM37-like n=1 Tax=Toxorhynchites rutilus septentrionalis TaxID=329112 RepID=UPI0024793EE5|nr:E3 ubiquitin-protein ligase TRIM37-like [Toxorhynchites rutilus septentrionalis]
MAEEVRQHQQQQLLQELSESLECQICLKTTDDPHLCPKCSKFFCYGCIRDWLQKSGKDACPNCVGTVKLAEFVKFRWGSGIETLRSLVTKQEPVVTGRNAAEALQKAQDTFAVVSEQITQTLADRREALKQSRDSLIKSINILVQQEFRDVNQQYHGKLAEVDAWSEILTKELNKTEVSLYALQEGITKETSPDTQQQLELQCQVLTKKLELLAPNVQEHKFYCKLLPAPVSWRFTVRNFSQARAANQVQYSDLVRDDLGNTWRLEIHPNGFDDARNKCVSVFLQLYEGVEGRYRYTIELPHRSQPHSYEDEDQFQLRKGWGQNHFIDRKALEDIFLENDSFEIRFSVRPPHLIEKYNCLRKYNEKLERDNSTLREECSVDCINEVCCIRNVADAVNTFGCLYSDTIRDDLGGSWRLQIFPGGNGDVKGMFICIFLELVEGIPNIYEFSVSLISEMSKKTIKKSLEHNFQPWMPFGWKNFVAREDFSQGDYVKKDALMIRLAIRPPTVGHKFNYLRQYHDKAIRDLSQAQPKPTSSLLSSKSFEAPISFLKKMLPRTPSQEQAGAQSSSTK